MGAAMELRNATPDGKISINVVRALVDTVETRGVPREQLLSAVRRDPNWVDNPATEVPLADYFKVCEAALDISNDYTLALSYGTQSQDQALQLITPLLKHAPTLRDALNALMRYGKLVGERVTFELREQHGQATLLYGGFHKDASIRAGRFATEMTLAGLYRLMRTYSPHGRIHSVDFSYAAPSYQTAYTDVFDACERFDQPFNGIVFESAMLDTPSPYKDEDLHSMLHSLAERRLMRMTRRTPYAVRAREVLVRKRSPQRVPMVQVARELDMSVRSLRRRLAEEGKSYRCIASDACIAVATGLITEQRQSIKETAYAMGFSNANSFHRAFKRWTGTTPNQFINHS